MKFLASAATAALLLASALAQTSTVTVDDDGNVIDNNGDEVDGKECPGRINGDYCCVGQSGGIDDDDDDDYDPFDNDNDDDDWDDDNNWDDDNWDNDNWGNDPWDNDDWNNDPWNNDDWNNDPWNNDDWNNDPWDPYGTPEIDIPSPNDDWDDYPGRPDYPYYQNVASVTVTVNRRAYPPHITPAPRLKARYTTVANGFTCYGIAVPVSLDEDEFSESVTSAQSVSRNNPQEFTNRRNDGTTIISFNGRSTTVSNGNWARTTITRTSDNTAPRMTGAAVLMGGLAGAVVFGAI